MINPSIFKAYDIRGIYPSEINEETAYLVGKAFVALLGAKKVIVGKDMRNSSESLFESLSKGMTEMGADVYNIGLCTTPMLNFSMAKYRFEGGVMISASHNSSQYNAFKLIMPPMLQLSAGFGMEELQRLATEGRFEKRKPGFIRQKTVLADYINHIKQFTQGIKGLKVVVDYGNGVGAISARPVLDSLRIERTHLFDDPDGYFPNHEANPHDLSNFSALKKEIVKRKADVGIFFDGDADRSVIVDETGNIIPPDILLGIFAQHLLEKYPSKTVYYDLRFSKSVPEMVTEKGGKPVMMKVGNPFYKEQMLKAGGAFAGELSGHIMFSDNFCIDDGLFAAVRFLDIMCSTKKKASELARPLKRYCSSEEISINVPNPDKTISKVRDSFTGGKSIDLDGVYLQWPDWWFNLRKSNTEPLVRLRVEADSEKTLKEKTEKILGIIRKS